MFYRSARLWRFIATTSIIILLIPSLILPSSVQSRKQSVKRSDGLFAHVDHDENKKKGLSREEREREAWVWHQANRLRLEREHGMRADAFTADIINQDVNDISVIQGDNRLITPQNLFDLGGLAVQFMPSGSGYTISSGIALFETNIGTKLDLTTAPAVNPRPEPEPGDDAYILQGLGFSFSFFGVNYTDIAVSSNGSLTFRSPGQPQGSFDSDTVSSGETLSLFQTGTPRIAPYWHDLDARASATAGTSGIFIRHDTDRVLVTWNDIRDFPNTPSVDRGIHRFQVSLFNTGRIVFTYAAAQLTSTALAGISPGLNQATTTLVELIAPPSDVISSPVGEFFSTSIKIDEIAVIQAFYATHPNRDVYDFLYLMTDFNSDLGEAFAFYQSIRNDVTGIGLITFDADPTTSLTGSQNIEGILNLSNINNYPYSPIDRFLGANHSLSIMTHEQGHRWLSFVKYPGNPPLLLGRADAHWSFFYSIESSLSSPGARRSSSMEGNVWEDNGNGTFTSVNLVDGYSRLDQYLMGLRPASDVPDTFVIANPFNTGGRTRESNPRPNVTLNGTRQNVTINEIIQANGARNPDSATSQRSFRAAVVLLVRQGTLPSEATLNKITRFRLAMESYFAQSTDYLATINTGLADLSTPRVISAASAASFKPTLAAGEIAALFGSGLTSGGTEAAISQPLPTILAGTQVLINGTPAPLFYASPLQVNFQVPLTTATQTINPPVPSATALIEVVSNGQLVRVGAFQIAPVVPAVFTINQTGTGAAAAVDAFTGAPGPFNARQANGEPNAIAVFGTGLGVDATDVDGDVKASTQVMIDNTQVVVTYAGQAPGFTGLNQLNVVFPADITPGTHTLVVSRNNIPGSPVTIEVR